MLLFERPVSGTRDLVASSSAMMLLALSKWFLGQASGVVRAPSGAARYLGQIIYTITPITIANKT
jgi:hypothetical protein